MAFGTVVGLDTVRAMDPLPQFIPAKPRAPYETPYMVPADLNASPVAVAVPAERPRPQAIGASYEPVEAALEIPDSGDALATSDVPSEVEIEPLTKPTQDDVSDLQ